MDSPDATTTNTRPTTVTPTVDTPNASTGVVTGTVNVALLVVLTAFGARHNHRPELPHADQPHAR